VPQPSRGKEKSLRITVFGASGGIGREIVRQALDAGQHVTAVVRTAADFTLSHPDLDVVRVTGLADPDPLVPALKSADAAISSVGPRGPRQVTVASTATRGILAALDLAGVRRFLAVSAVPVGPVPEGESFTNRRILLPLISTLLRGIYGDLAVMEREIRASGTEWTIVRPPRLVNGPVTGRYRTTIGGNVPRGRTLRRADVAHAMLAMVTDPATVRQAVGVAR
jgi:uncharacterized protein YbjT (DUF2867 family)